MRGRVITHQACPLPRSATEGRRICEGYEVLSPQKKNVGNGQLSNHITQGSVPGPSSSHFGFWLGEELVWTGFGWVLRARGESAAPQRVGSSVLRWRERFAEAAISDPPASWRFSTP